MQKHNNLQWFVLAIYKVNFSMKKRLQKLLKNFAKLFTPELATNKLI